MAENLASDTWVYFLKYKVCIRIPECARKLGSPEAFQLNLAKEMNIGNIFQHLFGPKSTITMLQLMVCSGIGMQNSHCASQCHSFLRKLGHSGILVYVWKRSAEHWFLVISRKVTVCVASPSPYKQLGQEDPAVNNFGN